MATEARKNLGNSVLCKICHESLAALGRDGVLWQKHQQYVANTEKHFIHTSSTQPYLCWAPYSY